MIKIYLAGPMDHITVDVSMGWRNKCKHLLEPQIKDGLIKILDPWRRPHNTGLTYKEIYTADLKDVRDADVLLVDIRPVKVETWGTASEVFYAHEILRKPIIGWYEKDNPPKGIRLFVDVMVSNQIAGLEEACEHIKEFYLS